MVYVPDEMEQDCQDRKFIVFLIVLFYINCFSIFITHAQGHVKTDRRIYRIATVTWVGWSPLQVAEEKGFWKELGLDVQVAIYDDPGVIIEAIKAERIDFAMDMVGSLAGLFMDGQSIVAIAETNWSHGGDKIIINKGENLRECKGKTIGVFLNLPSCWYFLGLYLNREGVKLSDYRIVELKPDDLSEQFIAGRIPIIVNYDPYTIKALEEGKGIELANSSEYEGCIPECMFTYRNILESIPKDDVAKILRGWIRAAEWINQSQHWMEYETILNERTFDGHPLYTSEQLKAMFAAVRIHDSDMLLKRNRDDGGLVRYLESLRIFLQSNGLLAKSYQPSELFDNRYILDALKSYDSEVD